MDAKKTNDQLARDYENIMISKSYRINKNLFPLSASLHYHCNLLYLFISLMLRAASEIEKKTINFIRIASCHEIKILCLIFNVIIYLTATKCNKLAYNDTCVNRLLRI